MKSTHLQIEQLEQKMKLFQPALKVKSSSVGWVRMIRTTLGMSLSQLGQRLSISSQGVKQIEIRESEGKITLNTLKEVATALDMELVYGLVPKDGSLEKLIERRARELATQIVSRTSTTMKLEDQENSKDRIRKAVDRRTTEIIIELPKILWD